MLSVLSVIIYAVVVLIAILLIALILVQPSKSGGGFGSAFGGLGESVFGAHAMGHLSKLTVVLITAFFVLTLLLAVVSGHVTDSSASSVLENVTAESASASPAASAPADKK